MLVWNIHVVYIHFCMFCSFGQHFGYRPILVLIFGIFETNIKILKNYMTLSRIKRLYKASAILTDNKTDILISGFIRIINYPDLSGYPDVREHSY